MNIISISADPTTWVGVGMMAVSSPLPPQCFSDMAALPTDVTLPELMSGEIAPGVVILSSGDFYDRL